MTQARDELATDLPVDADRAGALARRIAFVALLSIVLGFAIQGLILFAKLSGGAMPTASTIVADLTQGITWSLFVCVGVGIVTSISKARPIVAGLVAMLVAPLAVAIAKSGQKIMSGLLSAAEQEPVLSLSTVGALKALEYGVLGWLLARLVQRSEIRSSRYLGAGGRSASSSAVLSPGSATKPRSRKVCSRVRSRSWRASSTRSCFRSAARGLSMPGNSSAAARGSSNRQMPQSRPDGLRRRIRSDI